MKLILKKAMENLGDVGDIVEVKAGYGRNYLIPHGLAYEASSANVARLAEERSKAEERSRRGFLEARRRAAQLEGQAFIFHVRAGEEGKLFGSVTSADIAERANQGGLDFELDRRMILLDEPLRALGVFTVAVHLHPEVDVELEVRVEREGG
jgi:large subunit ribosomal protein L9